MATHVNTVAEVENWEVDDGLVTGTPTGGSGRFAFVAAHTLNVALGAPTIGDIKYGGSAGTLMTALGAGILGNSTVHRARGAYAVGGPSASTDAYADITTLASQRTGIGAQFFEGVDATTPYSDYTTVAPTEVSSGGSPVLASITIPNCTDGQMCVAWIAARHAADATIPTAVSGTTLGAAAIRTDTAEPTFTSVAMLRKVMSGTGNCVLEVNLNSSTSTVIGYIGLGMRLNDAGGGAPVLSLPTVTAITDTAATPRVTITI